jgi:hypothetical protein
MQRGVQASLFQAARDGRERRTLGDPSGYDEMIGISTKLLGS